MTFDRQAALDEATKRLGPWKQIMNTPKRSEYVAGEYTLIGTGYEYGNGLRRSWKLFLGPNLLGQPSRLSEAKRDAASDLAERVLRREWEAAERSAEVAELAEEDEEA